MKMKSLNRSAFPAIQTMIGKSEFANRTDLVSVELPSTITEIGDFAFEKCSNLESVVIPSSVQKIGVAAFCECTKLKKVVLPNGIAVIEDLLFGLCENLEEVVVPETVKVIRHQAFRKCKPLATITQEKAELFAEMLIRYDPCTGNIGKEVATSSINFGGFIEYMDEVFNSVYMQIDSDANVGAVKG